MLQGRNWITLQKERNYQLAAPYLAHSVVGSNTIGRYCSSRYLHRGPMDRGPMHRTTGYGGPPRGGGVIPDTPSPYPHQFYGSQAN